MGDITDDSSLNDSPAVYNLDAYSDTFYNTLNKMARQAHVKLITLPMIYAKVES